MSSMVMLIKEGKEGIASSVIPMLISSMVVLIMGAAIVPVIGRYSCCLKVQTRREEQKWHEKLKDPVSITFDCLQY